MILKLIRPSAENMPICRSSIGVYNEGIPARRGALRVFSVDSDEFRRSYSRKVDTR